MSIRYKEESDLKAHVFRHSGFAASPHYDIAIISRETLYVYSPLQSILSFKSSSENKLQISKIPAPDYNYPAKLLLPSNVNENFQLCNRQIFLPTNQYGCSYMNQCRKITWSPLCVDSYRNSILALVNTDGDAFFYRKNLSNQFIQYISFRKIWLTHLFKNGRNASELKNTKMTKKGLDETAINMNAKSVVSYMMFLEDFKFIAIEFLDSFVRVKKESHLLFVTLSKSGLITFWTALPPLVSQCQLNVILTDSKDSKVYENSIIKKHKQLIDVKIIHLNENVLMLRAYSNGEIYLFIYKISITDAKMNLDLISEQSLISQPIAFACVTTYLLYLDKRELYISYNNFIIRVSIDLDHFQHNVLIRELDNVILNITGMLIISGELFVVVQDGMILKTPLDQNLDMWQVIFKSDELSENDIACRQFYGVFNPGSDLFLNFIAEPDNFLEVNATNARSRLPSKIIRISLKSDEQLLTRITEMLQKEDPLNSLRDDPSKKLDLLSEIYSRMEDGSEYFDEFILQTIEKVDKLTLSQLVKRKIDSLQIYWYFCQFINFRFKSKIQEEERIREKIEYAICLNRNVYALKIFAVDQVQVNAGDCRLILSLACLMSSINKNNSETCLFNNLTKVHREEIKKLSEETFLIAEKMIRKNFKKGNDITLNDEEKCPICKEVCRSDILEISCSKGHRFNRCPQTSMILLNKLFSTCSQCSREYLSQEFGKPSEWHFFVRNQVCLFCQVPLISYAEE